MPNPGLLIRPETTALVVIDLQEKLVPAIDGREELLANTEKLLRLAEVTGLTTFLTTQYSKGLGATLPRIAELCEVEPIDKICFGCLADDPFQQALEKALPPGGTLLLAGVESHICVMQTALGALEKGYNVHVAADAVGSRSPANKAVGLDRMCNAGAVVSSTEMAIYELFGDSRNDEFKKMLPYLR